MCVRKSVLLVRITGMWLDVMSQASEAANRSLLFRLLFLVFIAHSHCLPATTTLLCETRAEKKKRFFPKWIWMHDTGKPVGRNPP